MRTLIGAAAGVLLAFSFLPAAAQGDAPVLPPSGGRAMLPEKQRLLETRLESSTWRPFNGFGIGSLWERGPHGWLNLSLGLSVGGRDGVRNLALNGGLELTPWLRTQVTAVARPHRTVLSSERLLQEAYLEAYRSWGVAGGELSTSLKAGSTQNTAFPYPDALSQFDLGGWQNGDNPRDFRGYKHLVGVADYAHRTGLGLHAGLSKRVTATQEGADTRAHMIDYYLRYRGAAAGLTLEARLGALNPGRPLTASELPNQPHLGQALYVGKDWQTASAGFLFEKIGASPMRYGLKLSTPLGAVSEALGNFLGRYHRRDHAVTAQLPIGTLLIGQRLKPPADGELVGTIRATRVYRTGSFLGGDEYPLNYEYVLDREGQTEGAGLTRVVAEGPRYLWEGGMLGGHGFGGTQGFYNFRQDLTYNLYRVAHSGVARLTGRVVDAAHPDHEVAGARITRLDAPEASRLLPVTGGKFSLEEKVSLSKPRAIKLMASAPGYLDEIVTATLTGGQNDTLEIRLKAAAGGLTVQLVDAETGEPIREAEVLIGETGATPKVSLTDEKGSVHAGALPPGRYRVATHAPRYYDQQAEIAVSAAGAERAVLRLKPRPGSIAGRIQDGAGKPLVGAAITITDAAGHGLGALTSLSDGTFGMTGLKPGRYAIAARAPGGAAGQATAEVRAGEIETVEITLK
jgi:hypothetical protein